MYVVYDLLNTYSVIFLVGSYEREGLFIQYVLDTSVSVHVWSIMFTRRLRLIYNILCPYSKMDMFSFSFIVHLEHVRPDCRRSGKIELAHYFLCMRGITRTRHDPGTVTKTVWIPGEKSSTIYVFGSQTETFWQKLYNNLYAWGILHSIITCLWI